MWFPPLFRKRTWSEFWISIRRANRDRRARKYLISVICLLLFFALWLSFELALARSVSTNEDGRFDPTGIVIACSLLAGAALILFVHRWTERREVNFSLRETSPAVSESIVSELVREIYLLAILLDRLGSERLLEKELPPQVESDYAAYTPRKIGRP